MGGADDFARELDAEWEAIEEDIREVVIELAEIGAERLVDRSPVASGQFKANWQVVIGEGDDVPWTDTFDPSGQATKGRLLSGIAAYRSTTSFPAIMIANSAPYGNSLEHGSSAQAPQGMVGLTAVELAAIADGSDV